jgi:hypothetical protein
VTDRDFQEWQGELVVPPVQDALRLADYLPDDMRDEFTHNRLFPDVLPYTWFLERNFIDALRWAKAAVLAYRTKHSVKSFTEPLLDKYNHDRALRMADVLETQPVLLTDIPHHYEEPSPVFGQPARTFRFHSQDLSDWHPKIPLEAVTAVALVLETEPPDKLWVVAYVEEVSRKGAEPIIYAAYGRWQVEVIRWD